MLSLVKPIYIYIYIEREREKRRGRHDWGYAYDAWYGTVRYGTGYKFGTVSVQVL